jgi:hypothetical protein
MKSYCIRLVGLMLLAALSGCGGSNRGADGAGAKPIIGPHGAAAMPLADGKAYVEVLLERPKTATGRKVPPPMLVAYFLQENGKEALSPLPDTVEASVRPPGKDAPVTVKLDPKPGASGPAAEGRFASEPGDLDYDDLHGELTATLGGQPVKVEFVVH